MNELDGWRFWASDSGHVRHFDVAEPDLEKARQLLRKKFPDVELVSWHEISAYVLKMRGEERGSVTEVRRLYRNLRGDDPVDTPE